MTKEFRGLELTIDGGNAAFGDSPGEAMAEVKRILSRLMASELATFDDSTPEIDVPLVDRCGNTVGRIEVVYNNREEEA